MTYNQVIDALEVYMAESLSINGQAERAAKAAIKWLKEHNPEGGETHDTDEGKA